MPGIRGGRIRGLSQSEVAIGLEGSAGPTMVGRPIFTAVLSRLFPSRRPAFT